MSIVSNQKRGSILIVVAVVIALVSLALYGFVVLMQAEHLGTHLHGDQLQADAVADSGLELVVTMVDMPRSERQLFGGLESNDAIFKGQVVDSTDAARLGRYSVVSSTSGQGGEVDASFAQQAEPSTMFRFGLTNESAKINLKSLLSWESDEYLAANALLRLPGMTPEIADSILDWIDRDDEPREFGAEAASYLLAEENPIGDQSGSVMDNQFGPPNKIPSTIFELFPVKGVTKRLLMGIDENRNFRVEPFELSKTATEIGGAFDLNSDSSAGGVQGSTGESTPWVHFLTVQSAERNLDFEGNPRINLNEKDEAKLIEQLTLAFNEEIAKFVALFRRLGPYEGPQLADTAIGKINLDKVSASERPKAESDESNQDVSSGDSPADDESLSGDEDGTQRGERSGPFASVLDIIGAKVAVPNEPSADGSESPPSIVASPFSSESLSGSSQLLKWCDQTTTTARQKLIGRVNVDYAPPEVLLAVPGMDVEIAQRIMAARSSASSDAEARRHPIWLVTERVLTTEQAKQVIPYLTSGGDVFSGQIVAFYDDQSPWSRSEFNVDGTVQPSRISYRRDLSVLGRGFRVEELAEVVDAAQGVGDSQSNGQAGIGPSASSSTDLP